MRACVREGWLTERRVQLKGNDRTEKDGTNEEELTERKRICLKKYELTKTNSL